MTGLPAPPPLGTAMLPPGTFEDRVVLITGGGTGIGKAIAVEFARLGATVAVVSRRPEHLQAGVEAVEAAGGRAVVARCDVREPDSVGEAFDAVEEAAGPVDALVNNAAGNFPGLAEELSPRAWRAVTQIVLDGTFFCSTELARRSIPAGRPGAIVNIGATYSWTGGPGTSHSAAAKAAVWNLTMSLAVEWAPHAIRVNGLAPGLFPHDDLPAALRGRNAPGDDPGRRIPAGRVGQLHELGWAATYLCSPFAAYLTGHTLVLDGANWLRRGLQMPEFVPVAEQLGPRS
ncbi:MAG: SDR family oxidoreductase [Acidimicrobiia bacterium]|nr:SDR family oxidoreductase [Acidimicrobiia bacterium]